MLGEQLFPLVKSIEHDFAGKVTGIAPSVRVPKCFEEKSFRSHGRFGASWTHVLRRFLTCCFLVNFFQYAFCLLQVSYSSGFLDMFKYAISTKMEVLNLRFIKKIISQEHGAYNLVELLCKDRHRRYP
ncbi:hypothetical protein MKW98_006165 [Papaver atlanticum]|uniref:PABC domain-containing protein n=1 Tax=Papaver atlanticum TaxID=357466 RepID=A0AAD4XW47_9MAGN|nr:hypothetical protein MKW98_006165 [Papaver atlanticum]